MEVLIVSEPFRIPNPKLRKHLFVLLSLICLCAACTGAYIFIKSDCLQKLRKADNTGTTVTFLDMGISASLETPDALLEKRDYILAHIRIERCTEYFDGIKHKAEFYDQSGNKIETVYYTDEGNISSGAAFSYDEKGNCISEVHYKSDSKAILFTMESEYDERGNLTRFVEYHSNGSIYRVTKFSYDVDGNEIERVCCDADGTLLWGYKNTYSKDAGSEETVQEELQYNGQNQIEYRSKMWFDANKNRIKYMGYDYDGTLLQWALTEYNSNNQPLRHEAWYDGTCTSDLEYIYDESGLLQTVIDYNLTANASKDGDSEKIPFIREEYFYNAVGNCTRKVYHYDSDISSVWEFEYQYVFEE